MNINNKYYRLVINPESFHFVEMEKLQDQDPLDLLSRIESVLKNNFKYNPEKKDTFSELTQSALLDLLSQKTAEIYKAYRTKQAEPWFITNALEKLCNYGSEKLFGKMKRINEIYARISKMNLTPVYPLSNELIQNILNYLEVSNLGKFAQVSRHAKAHADTVFLRKARELGYEGEDCVEASEHIKSLFCDFKRIEIFLGDFDAREGRFNPEASLEKRKLHVDFIGRLGDTPLHLAIRMCSFPYVKFIVKSGANIHKQNNDRETPLILASRCSTEIVKFLIKHGADYKILSIDNCNLLHNAVLWDQANTVKLLLEYGLDVNARNVNGKTPLGLTKGGITYTVSKEVRNLLLEKGATE